MTRHGLFSAILYTFVLYFAPFSGISPTFAKEVSLSGTLISTNGRSALVNGKMVREGDRVAGIRILAIDEHSIRVHSGSHQRVLRVGATADLEPAAASTSTVARQSQPRLGLGVQPRRVERGDTLSEIARDYVAEGVTLNQVILAIFEQNPEAFDNNINRLYAGAELRIPEAASLGLHDRIDARAEVGRQTIAWQREQSASPDRHNFRVSSQTTPPSSYGPVRPGETLSEIAAELAPGVATPNQMMIALFTLNPSAFGNGMDVLHAGATLRVPNKEQALLAFSARAEQR